MTREEFVARLRDKRRECGLNLEEIVEKTKLPPSAIKRLESGRWEEMNPFYLKGFLKIYCSFLQEELDEALLEERRPQEEAAPLIKPRNRQGRTGSLHLSLPRLSLPKIKIPPIPSQYIRIAITIGVILILLVSSIWVLKKIGAFVISLFRHRPVANEVVFSDAGDDQPQQVSSFAQKEEISVTLTAKRNCFVRVRREGAIVFEGILKKGAVETWQAKKELEFKISDGTAVDVEVNDQILPALTKIRKPIKSLKVTPVGIFVDK